METEPSAGAKTISLPMRHMCRMKFGRLFMPVRYDANRPFEQMNPR
jgi:hypothetical protein